MGNSDASSGLDDVAIGADIRVPDASGSLDPMASPGIPADDLLVRHKLSLTRRESAAGERSYAVSGDTYPYRDGLRAAGGTWNGVRQHWEFCGEDPTAAIAAWLAEHGDAARAPHAGTRTGGATGFADIAPPEIDRPPHYWGHRARLRERLLEGGDEALADYELLELLLFYTVKVKDTKPLAKALLEEFGSLSKLLNADLDRFEDFAARATAQNLAPVDRKAVVLFRALRALTVRLTREEVPVGTELTNWDKLIAYLRASMAHRPIEQFRLLFLDRRNVLIADEKQNEGSIDHTPVYPREVVKRALALDASALIMVHNHPSNHPHPSRGDIEMTQIVKTALNSVGVVLHDHVIISRKGHSSFKQLGLL